MTDEGTGGAGVGSAVQVADGVWRVPTAPQDLVNSLLLEDADGSLTLVDAGTKRASTPILAALAGLGRAPQDVTRLLVTHAHPDHAGGLAAVQQATGGEVLAHDREAVYLRDGKAPKSDTSTFGGRLLNRLPGGSFPRVQVARTFADGELLDVAGGLRVVHTPGHSPGHVSLVHEPTGVLFTGDAVFNVRGLRYPPRMLCTDVRLTHETAARLGDLDFGVAVFTHGTHLSSGAREAVRAFVAGRPQ